MTCIGRIFWWDQHPFWCYCCLLPHSGSVLNVVISQTAYEHEDTRSCGVLRTLVSDEVTNLVAVFIIEQSFEAPVAHEGWIGGEQGAVVDDPPASVTHMLYHRYNYTKCCYGWTIKKNTQVCMRKKKTQFIWLWLFSLHNLQKYSLSWALNHVVINVSLHYKNITPRI